MAGVKKGRRCKNCRGRLRYVSTGACVKCRRARVAERYERRKRNPAQALELKAELLLKNTRKRAKKKRVGHDLTKAWILTRLESGHCEVTGLAFEYGKPKAPGRVTQPRGPSLHRVDRTKGYTQCNTVLVIHAYNMAVFDGTHAELVAFCRMIVELEDGPNEA